MEIRLRATPAELTATLTALAKTLDITHISRVYPDWPLSITARVYLTAESKENSNHDH